MRANGGPETGRRVAHTTPHPGLPNQAVSLARPLPRRADTMARPARVRIRRRKPWTRARRRLFGWNVRLPLATVNTPLGGGHRLMPEACSVKRCSRRTGVPRRNTLVGTGSRQPPPHHRVTVEGYLPPGRGSNSGVGPRFWLSTAPAAVKHSEIGSIVPRAACWGFVCRAAVRVRSFPGLRRYLRCDRG